MSLQCQPRILSVNSGRVDIVVGCVRNQSCMEFTILKRALDTCRGPELCTRDTLTNARLWSVATIIIVASPRDSPHNSLTTYPGMQGDACTHMQCVYSYYALRLYERLIVWHATTDLEGLVLIKSQILNTWNQRDITLVSCETGALLLAPQLWLNPQSIFNDYQEEDNLRQTFCLYSRYTYEL